MLFLPSSISLFLSFMFVPIALLCQMTSRLLLLLRPSKKSELWLRKTWATTAGKIHPKLVANKQLVGSGPQTRTVFVTSLAQSSQLYLRVLGNGWVLWEDGSWSSACSVSSTDHYYCFHFTPANCGNNSQPSSYAETRQKGKKGSMMRARVSCT